MKNQEAIDLYNAYQSIYSEQEINQEVEIAAHCFDEALAQQISMFGNKGLQRYVSKSGKTLYPFPKLEPLTGAQGPFSRLPPPRPTPPRTSQGQLEFDLSRRTPPRPTPPSRPTSPSSSRPSGVLNTLGTIARTAAALKKLSPVGVAAATLEPRPTAPGTINTAPKIATSAKQVKTGEIFLDPSTRVGHKQRFAQRLKVGPGIVGPKLSTAQRFDKAYSAAAKSNKSNFTFDGKNYKVEEVQSDLFDTILEYLVAEGYVDTNQKAIAIMANMSEEWRQNILNQRYND